MGRGASPSRVHSVAEQRPGTRFAIAGNGSKTFTAAAVLSLVADGALTFDTRARAILGTDLPLIADDVTVEHLLTHRSGIGDYLDEDAGLDVTDYPMPVSVHASTGSRPSSRCSTGIPRSSAAGTDFSYCNGGFVVLALIAERVSGTPSPSWSAEPRPRDRRGWIDSGFPRSDALPPNTATGYKDDGRTNIFDLPVVASGDGGAYTTAADVHRLWGAFTAGAVLPTELWDAMREPVTPDADDGRG